MKFDTDKQKGNMGVAIAIAYYTSFGYTVSIPLNDTQEHEDGKFHRTAHM